MKIRLLDVTELNIDHHYNNGDIVFVEDVGCGWGDLSSGVWVLSHHEFTSKESISWERIKEGVS